MSTHHISTPRDMSDMGKEMEKDSRACTEMEKDKEMMNSNKETEKEARGYTEKGMETWHKEMVSAQEKGWVSAQENVLARCG